MAIRPKFSHYTMSSTLPQYNHIIHDCRSLFLRKTADYGTAWTILRMPSITDQIYIKAERIRTLQETGKNKVGDSIEGEFVGIINYCIIALILLDVHKGSKLNLENLEVLAQKYDEKVEVVRATMLNKNHDYGEAWRKMRISSMTDLILMKIFRVKQIEDNQGKTFVSEGVDANYIDMMNYAVFCLILMREQAEKGL